ncbi:hypothetical protein DIPPA_20870 [Diplonema papillatum]|nr:hypothetical protein DIPPA_20870 [Diplonema papillatum]
MHLWIESEVSGADGALRLEVAPDGYISDVIVKATPLVKMGDAYRASQLQLGAGAALADATLLSNRARVRDTALEDNGTVYLTVRPRCATVRVPLAPDRRPLSSQHASPRPPTAQGSFSKRTGSTSHDSPTPPQSSPSASSGGKPDKKPGGFSRRALPNPTPVFTTVMSAPKPSVATLRTPPVIPPLNTAKTLGHSHNRPQSARAPAAAAAKPKPAPKPARANSAAHGKPAPPAKAPPKRDKPSAKFTPGDAAARKQNPPPPAAAKQPPAQRAEPQKKGKEAAAPQKAGEGAGGDPPPPPPQRQSTEEAAAGGVPSAPLAAGGDDAGRGLQKDVAAPASPQSVLNEDSRLIDAGRVSPARSEDKADPGRIQQPTFDAGSFEVPDAGLPASSTEDLATQQPAPSVTAPVVTDIPSVDPEHPASSTDGSATPQTALSGVDVPSHEGSLPTVTDQAEEPAKPDPEEAESSAAPHEVSGPVESNTIEPCNPEPASDPTSSADDAAAPQADSPDHVPVPDTTQTNAPEPSPNTEDPASTTDDTATAADPDAQEQPGSASHADSTPGLQENPSGSDDKHEAATANEPETSDSPAAQEEETPPAPLSSSPGGEHDESPEQPAEYEAEQEPVPTQEADDRQHEEPVAEDTEPKMDAGEGTGEQPTNTPPPEEQVQGDSAAAAPAPGLAEEEATEHTTPTPTDLQPAEPEADATEQPASEPPAAEEKEEEEPEEQEKEEQVKEEEGPVDWLERFRAFYSVHNPDKVESADILMERYDNDEDRQHLWSMMLSKYDVTEDTWMNPRRDDDESDTY